MIQWGEQQSKALKLVEKWFLSKPRKPVFRLDGFAGTGKTTLAKYFAETVGSDVMYAAYTGKAALMMRKNGCRDASTIHSLIYKATEDRNGVVTYSLNSGALLRKAKLLIIDEHSMVDEKIGRDLMSFGVPVLALGDPAQLPPVNGEGYFTSRTPDVMLTEIHRQAKDNPIIELATIIREGGIPNYGKYGDTLITQKLTLDMLDTHDQILAGRNKTRTDLNNKVRRRMGYEPEVVPQIKEKLICLQNDSTHGIFNGQIFSILDLPNYRPNDQFMKITLQDLDEENRKPILVNVHKSYFNDDVPKPHWKSLKNTQSFNFAYCLTGHKSQGSQFDSSLIIDESWCFREDAAKWLYTVCTRSIDRFTLVRK